MEQFLPSATTSCVESQMTAIVPTPEQPPFRPSRDTSSVVGESIPPMHFDGTSLSSLLPPDDVWPDSPLGVRTATQQTLFGFSAFRQLISSIENNFASLDGVPIARISEFLRKYPGIRSHIPQYLRTNPKNASKALAEKLTRAAIEDRDASFVTELTAHFVSANEVVCIVDGRRYTAVERSAMLRDIDVTSALLAVGADVNNTYETDPRKERGALELAFRKIGNFSPSDMIDKRLLNILLGNGAIIHMGLAYAAIRSTNANLIEEFVMKVPQSEHSSAFKEGGIMFSALRRLDNKLAAVIVKRMFEHCSDSGCNDCPRSNPQIIESLVTFAAERGFLDLVIFLVDHIVDPSRLLIGAVRSGRKDIIDLLLARGAKVDIPALGIDERSSFVLNLTSSSMSDLTTTPLAEAIRGGKNELIQDLENRGALSQINDSRRFVPAIFAASEVGNLAYVLKLLKTSNNTDGKRLSLALSVAIKAHHGQVALALLKAGADVNERITKSTLKQPLEEALIQRDETLVRKIVDCDIGIRRLRHRNVLVTAVQWGVNSFVRDLLALGARAGSAEVTIAVKARNKPLVKLLLSHGASLERPSYSESSPLEAAISNKDVPMLRYLLDAGADPSCPSAWSAPALQDKEIFDITLRAFRCKYPKGKSEFGSAALQSALEREDFERIYMLIEAGADVNSISGTGIYEQKSTLGMAIAKYGGRRLDIIDKVLSVRGDPNSIVSRPTAYSSEYVWPQRTALLEAIQTKSVDLVRLLIDKGADIHRTARLGVKRTPLQYACEIGCSEIADLLISRGVDINEEPATRGGATALQLCAIQGYCKIAYKLVRRGAKIWAAPAEYNGQTVFEGAAENGRLDMLMMLWQLTNPNDFSEERRRCIMKLAEKNGHIACAEFVQGLDLPGQGLIRN